MKSLLFLCSLMLLSNAPSSTNSLNPICEEQETNPFIKLAEIKNSMNMSIDDYVNNIVEVTNADPADVLFKAKQTDSWLYKSFIHDSKYMERMYKMHVFILKHYDEGSLESAQFFEELKLDYPYFAELLPILSSPGQRNKKG